MSKPVIFLGPTLPRQEAVRILDAIYLPPAAQGDVFNACKEYNPRSIGLIDGYFECIPSVWHKEILFAMDEGIHVVGGSSMGALRAAELHQFGMVGVGQVFSAYKSGVIEDDDEVAVLHGPEDIGYPALSEAMINIRVTLDDALQRGVITDEEEQLLTSVAKGLFYKNRTYAKIIDKAVSRGFTERSRHRFTEWLSTGRRNAKREDALELLKFLKEQEALLREPKKVEYRFNNTIMWMNLLQSSTGDTASKEG